MLASCNSNNLKASRIYKPPISSISLRGIRPQRLWVNTSKKAQKSSSTVISNSISTTSTVNVVVDSLEFMDGKSQNQQSDDEQTPPPLQSSRKASDCRELVLRRIERRKRKYFGLDKQSKRQRVCGKSNLYNAKMIHNPSMLACGDTAEMKAAIKTLNEVKESIINAYEIKTKLNRDEISRLMDAETWFNANKAVELGFADKVMFSENKSAENLSAVAFSRMTVTNSLIDKIKNKKKAAGNYIDAAEHLKHRLIKSLEPKGNRQRLN